MRYDQFMALGWKWLIPASLAWIVAVATIRAVSLDGGVDHQYLLTGIGVALLLLLSLSFWPAADVEEEDAETAADAGANGLPDPSAASTGGAARGSAQALYVDLHPIPPKERLMNAAYPTADEHADDRSSAIAVFESHRPHLMGVAYRILGSVTDSEDVLQEAWLRWSRTDPHGRVELRGLPHHHRRASLAGRPPETGQGTT